jgi:hypothetical protein
MKIFLTIISILLILMGAVWFLQGISVLPGSVMTGQSQWVFIGALLVIIGIGLLIYTYRRKGSPRP